jgi:FixJ family two-component response regulator
VNTGDHLVYVVDDDRSSRQSLEFLLKASGFGVRAFASAQEFLGFSRPESPGCLVLDVRMPGLTGLDLQEQLVKIGFDLPIIFMTGFGDVPMSVRAMKAGAMEFLIKPFRAVDMVRAVSQAIEHDRLAHAERLERAALNRRYARLTPREQEVMASVVAGLLNKQIAAELGAAEKTIKAHRGRVMRKMEAASVADLVRSAEKLRPTARSEPKGSAATRPA